MTATTADIESMMEATPAHQVSMGVSPAEMGVPRPELNGCRVRVPGEGAIYLVDEGYRRLVPNPNTYNQLFRNWDGIISDTGVVDISIGNPISVDAVLGMSTTAPQIYLCEYGMKRHVTSKAAMDRYWFNYSRVYKVPPEFIQSLKDGPKINWPQ